MANISPIVALRIADPARWRLKVRAALRAARGDLAVAATALGVARRTLNRWIACQEGTDRCGVCEGCGLVKGIAQAKGGPRWAGFDTEFCVGVPSLAAVALHEERHGGAWEVETGAQKDTRHLCVVDGEVRAAVRQARRVVWLPLGELGQAIRCRPVDAEGQAVRWHVDGLPPPGGRPRKR